MAGVLSGAGPRRWPRSFADRLTAPLPGPRELLRLHREGGFRGSTEGADRIPVRRQGLPPLRDATASVTWIGHASFLLRIGGLAVLVDPVFSESLPGVGRRLTPPGLCWEQLPRIDAVLVSHDHYDHLDAPTIRLLPRDTPVLVPASTAPWFTRRGLRAVRELDWWESTELTGVRFDFVPSHHWSRRGLLDSCRRLWGGWVLTAGDARLYHAGDSGYGRFFAEIGERHPGIDVAMLPVGAYEPRWFMGAIHTDPDEAVRAAADLGAARMVPMHWGTFLLSREPVLDPLLRTRAAWKATGRAQDDLWDLAVGETRQLPRT